MIDLIDFIKFSNRLFNDIKYLKIWNQKLIIPPPPSGHSTYKAHWAGYTVSEEDVTTGVYQFSDGLEFQEDTDWEYCQVNTLKTYASTSITISWLFSCLCFVCLEVTM